MKNFIEAIFDFIFPKEVDNLGNEIEPKEDNTYTEKVWFLILLLGSIIIAGIVLID